MTHKRTTAPLAIAAAIVGAAFASNGSARGGQETPYDKINAATTASPVTAVPVRGNVILLEGAGGNIAALSGSDGLLLVDAGIAVSRSKLVAHPNTARHFGETIRVEEWGHTFAPLPAGYRPASLVSDSKIMRFDGEAIHIRHYMNAHTDGDLSVYFRDTNVLATGDTWWNGMYPFIDYAAGGSIDGMIAAANANVALVNANTKVIPGHGPMGGRKDLTRYRDMLVTIRSRVASLKAQGLSLQQTVASGPTASFDAEWGKGVITPALFTELVYRGIDD